MTVAQNIDLLNHGALQNIGAKLLIDASAKSNEESGDGTTSTTVIASAILKHGQKMIQHGSSVMDVKIGMHKAVTQIAQKLDDMAHKIETREEVRQIAMVSSN